MRCGPVDNGSYRWGATDLACCYSTTTPPPRLQGSQISQQGFFISVIKLCALVGYRRHESSVEGVRSMCSYSILEAVSGLDWLR